MTGHEILSNVEAFLTRFVAYPSEAARVAHVLWTAHTHMMPAWDSTPRMAFLSPEPGSGKTRALEVSELLVPSPVEAVNMSAAALFRVVASDNGLPTILFDEVDTVFGSKSKAEQNEDVRGLLNAGHRRGAKSYRCVMRGQIAEVHEYEAFCAVALAGLGDLPDTILTRSVIVRMRRRAPNERVEPFRRRLEEKTGHALRDTLAAWAQSVIDTIGDPWPEMPAGIEDRNADVWESLIAVADAAGGEWPERARAAAVTLVTDSQENTPSLGIRLLEDVRTVFEDAAALPTERILEALNGLPESPWSTIRNGGRDPLNALGLSQRLRQYEIHSKTIRRGDTTAKGYRREDFTDAWSRYLSPCSEKPGTPVTPVTRDENASNEPGFDVTYTDPSPRNTPVTHSPSNGAVVTPVTPVTGFQGDGGREAEQAGFDSERDILGEIAALNAKLNGSSERVCPDCKGPLPAGRLYVCADCTQAAYERAGVAP